MALEKITYFDLKGKRKSINVKKVSVFSWGLIFRRKSPPLFFCWRTSRTFSIFCKPFTATWLDENMRATKVVEVDNWKWNIRGRGKFLLEIPKG